MRAHERRRSRGDAPTVAGRRPQMNETRPDGFCRRVGDKRIFRRRGAQCDVRVVVGAVRFRWPGPCHREADNRRGNRRSTRRATAQPNDRAVQRIDQARVPGTRSHGFSAADRRARKATGRTRRPAMSRVDDGISARRSRSALRSRWRRAARRARRGRWGGRGRSSHPRKHPR